MSGRKLLIRQVLLGLVILGLLGIGVGWMLRAQAARTANTQGLDQLLADHKFQEVEDRLQETLSVRPDDPQANMLMAQVALARTDQKPELALQHLNKVHLPGRRAQAIVALNRGKAYSAMSRYADAEEAWFEALRIDPLVPEAGWAVLGLYYVQGRRDDAHRLAMKLRISEPDPRDRAQLLLELFRQDAKPLWLQTLIPILRPAVQNQPEDKYSTIALARALISASQPDEGLPLLHELLDRFPEDPPCWEALLSGLLESFHNDELEQAMLKLPAPLKSAPRFEKYRGVIAQAQKRWDEAIRAYRRSLDFEPCDRRVIYRLCQTLRAAGQPAEADLLEPRRKSIESAYEGALKLYQEANAVWTLGTEPHTDLYQRLADSRERMGRPDEAVAWHRLVLRFQPDDPVSQAAVQRLAKP